MVAPAARTDGLDRAHMPRGFLAVRGSLRSPFCPLLPFFLMSLRPLFPHKCSWLGGMGLHREGDPAPSGCVAGKRKKKQVLLRQGLSSYSLLVLQLLGPLSY